MHGLFARFSNSQRVFILAFAVYWSGFLYSVVLHFTKIFSLFLKTKVLYKQYSQMECGWGVLFAKFLLTHGWLTFKELTRRSKRGRNLGWLWNFLCVCSAICWKRITKLGKLMAKWRRVHTPGPSIPLSGLGRVQESS